MLTLFEERIDIMFQHIRDALKKEQRLIAKAQDEVYQSETGSVSSACVPRIAGGYSGFFGNLGKKA